MMTLLDTHALVWFVEGVPRLGRKARRLIERSLAADDLAVSAISFWEVSLRVEKGRLRLSRSPTDWRLEVLGLGIAEIPLTGDVAIAATELDGLHPDPSDRILIATARIRRGLLVKGDGPILSWRVDVLSDDSAR